MFQDQKYGNGKRSFYFACDTDKTTFVKCKLNLEFI